MALSNPQAPPEVPIPARDIPPATGLAGATLRDDALTRRLSVAFLVSVAVNAALWYSASRFVRNHIVAPPPPIEIRRIILPPVRHQIVKPKPKPKIVPPKPPPPVKRLPQPKPPPTPTPPQHHRVITAPLTHGAPSPGDQTALPGGNAKLGAPIEHQTPAPVAPAPPPPVQAPPVQHEASPPPVQAPPQHVASPPPPPSGPTQDAQPDNQVKPDIPDDLKQQEFKSFVRVRVEIDAGGGFTVVLRTSSGNAEIDQRVLDALKQWKWKPALKDGVPVKSTQLFKFEFLVE